MKPAEVRPSLLGYSLILKSVNLRTESREIIMKKLLIGLLALTFLSSSYVETCKDLYTKDKFN